LRLKREKLLFDICAAPFGTGSFVSYRLVDRRFPWDLLIFLLLLAAGVLLILMFVGIAGERGIATAMGAVAMIVMPVAAALVFGWIFLWKFRRAFLDIDRLITMMPTLGPHYEHFTGRNTYYRIDCILMFQEAVHHAVMEVIDQQTEAQHLQPLSQLERKPVMSQLLLR